MVIAISTILLGLLFGPIFQTFNVTNRVRAITSAQDAARFGLERITRELAQAAFVYDNSVTPVVVPLGNNKRDRVGGATVDIGRLVPEGYDRTRGEVPFSFAKVDFVPAAQAQSAAGATVDPTTGQQFRGRSLQFPLAPGTRLVRYFLGLRRNFSLADNAVQPLTYVNPYEFRSDSGPYNPLILYRAEFDPRDPSLIAQGADVKPSARNGGGLNDPNFFYNTNKAANGRTYAENWKAIASPLVSALNLDLLAWNRGGGNNQQLVSVGLPFRATAGFTPATVVGDTATPGFLSDVANANPHAVPSVYSAQNGLWVYPYSVSVYRWASRNNTADPRYGFLRVVFQHDPKTGEPVAVVPQNGSGGSLTVPPQSQNDRNFVARRSARGTWFVKSAGVTFQVDPLRGRITTAFAPLAGDGTGLPVFDANNEPIQTVLRMNTRRLLAGRRSPLLPEPPVSDPIRSANDYPYNAGVTSIYLAPELTNDPEDPNLQTRRLYYRLPLPAGALPPAPDAAGDSVSPFATFGPVLVVPGSERVLAPEPNASAALTTGASSITPLVPYFAISPTSSFNYPNTPEVVGVSFPRSTTDPGLFVSDLAGAMQYQPLFEGEYALRPRIRFDQWDSASGVLAGGRPVRGLPAVPAAAPAAAQKEVQVSYLWQNNYAREVSVASGDPQYNFPVNAAGSTVWDTGGGAIRPEPDVVKVDYSTRSLMNVRLGARVYDATSGQSNTIEVADRVKINNVGR